MHPSDPLVQSRKIWRQLEELKEAITQLSERIADIDRRVLKLENWRAKQGKTKEAGA